MNRTETTGENKMEKTYDDYLINYPDEDKKIIKTELKNNETLRCNIDNALSVDHVAACFDQVLHNNS